MIYALLISKSLSAHVIIVLYLSFFEKYVTKTTVLFCAIVEPTSCLLVIGYGYSTINRTQSTLDSFS